LFQCLPPLLFSGCDGKPHDTNLAATMQELAESMGAFSGYIRPQVNAEINAIAPRSV
jgi:hypothetical protein